MGLIFMNHFFISSFCFISAPMLNFGFFYSMCVPRLRVLGGKFHAYGRTPAQKSRLFEINLHTTEHLLGMPEALRSVY